MSELATLLVNLPAGFFTAPQLAPIWERLESLATVRRASANTAEEILPHLRDADAVLMWSWPRLTPDLLDQCPRLRFSANIDITQSGARTLLERNIPVSLGRRGFSPAVAEMALTLILATLRRTSTYHARMASGTETWVNKFPDDIPVAERELTGRRVGLIGFGGVGQRLASLLAPFQCDLKVYDPHLPDAIAKKFKVETVPLELLLLHSEILVLCAAANEGSKHLLETRHIEALTPGAILVNVARASLIDSDALLSRLLRGDLYAALDVFDQEPLPPNSPLRRLPNVYLTPHRAGGTWESVARILLYLVDDLAAFQTNSDRRHALTEAMLPSLDA